MPSFRIGGNKFHAADNSPPWTFPSGTLHVDHNISHPRTTDQANAIKNYAPPKVSENKKKHIGPGGIAFMVGGGTLVATCVALFIVEIRFCKLHAQSLDLKNFESNHSSLHSHPTSATIGKSYRSSYGFCDTLPFVMIAN